MNNLDICLIFILPTVWPCGWTLRERVLALLVLRKLTTIHSQLNVGNFAHLVFMKSLGNIKE